MRVDLPVITGAVPAAECVPGKRITSPAVRDALVLLDMARSISDECYRRISDVAVGTGETLILYTAEFGVPVIVRRGDLASQTGDIRRVLEHHRVPARRR